MTPDPDRHDLGRRVLEILGRDAGRTDADLAALLGVTEAELSPVIGMLYRQGRADRCGPWIVPAPGQPPRHGAGTSGTCGTSAAHSACAGFPPRAQTPEP